MINRTTMTSMKKTSIILLGFGIFLMTIFACGTVKETTNGKISSNYIVKQVPNSENYYEGNIIVEVFDSNNQELIGATVVILSDGEKISELVLKTTAMGVFYKEQKNISVTVSKEGYEDVKTNNIEMSSDRACFIEARLLEK
jgi:hypothetical protein